MYTQTASHDDHHTPTGWKRWAYSTNHKDIGTMYLIFAIVAGVIGTASLLTPKAGKAQACNTSLAVIKTLTTLFTGTTTSLSTARSLG